MNLPLFALRLTLLDSACRIEKATGFRLSQKSPKFSSFRADNCIHRMALSSRAPAQAVAQNEYAKAVANKENERKRRLVIEPGRKISDPRVMRDQIIEFERLPINRWTRQPRMLGYAAVAKTRETLSLRQDEQFTQILAMLLAEPRVMIMTAPMGSGKSTQIPQLVAWYQLLRNNENSKGIVCTQPSDLTAKTCGERLRHEMDVAERGYPDIVGYKYRGVKFVDSRTKITIMTDEQLLKSVMMQPQSLSENYEFVIIDEVHERTVATDVLLLFLKEEIKRKDSKLRLIIMSATLDTERFRLYFAEYPRGPAVVRFEVPPRFEVNIYHLAEPAADLWNEVCSRVCWLLKGLVCDTIVFLPDERAIDTVEGLI